MINSQTDKIIDNIRATSRHYKKWQTTYCIVPFRIVPNRTLLRYSGSWWIKTACNKMEHVTFPKVVSFPHGRELVSISKVDTFLLSSKLKMDIINEFNADIFEPF